MSRLRRAVDWCRFVRTYVLRHPYNRGRPIAAAGRVLAWQVRKRLSARPIATRAPDGIVVRVNRAHSCSSLIHYVGLPEYDDLSFVRDLLRADDWFVDVGANVGIYTLLAAGRVHRGRVIAFEPDARARRELERNVRLNGLGNVEVRGEAVGEASRMVWFSKELDTRNHVVEGPGPGPRQLTPMVTLDAVCLPARIPAIVKVDAEGYGGAVLDGADGLLRYPRPPVWIVEVHGGDTEDGSLVSRLRRLSYVPCVYDPDLRNLREHGRSRWSDNLIFIRSDGLPAVRRRLGGP